MACLGYIAQLFSNVLDSEFGLFMLSDTGVWFYKRTIMPIFSRMSGTRMVVDEAVSVFRTLIFQPRP